MKNLIRKYKRKKKLKELKLIRLKRDMILKEFGSKNKNIYDIILSGYFDYCKFNYYYLPRL